MKSVQGPTKKASEEIRKKLPRKKSYKKKRYESQTRAPMRPPTLANLTGIIMVIEARKKNMHARAKSTINMVKRCL